MRKSHSILVCKFLIFLSLVCGLFLFSASQLDGQKKNAASTPDISAASRAEAKLAYESVCATCHGLDARGSERGPDIATRPEVIGKTDRELMAVLKEGRVAAGMPSFVSLGPSRLVALVVYLRALQGRGVNATLPGNGLKGRALFFEKAQCAECHMVNGKGGFLGPDLTNFAARLSTGEVRDRIVNPDKDLDPRRGLVQVTLADSTSFSGVVRNEDNFSLQLQTSDGAFHLLNKSDIRAQIYTGRSAMSADYGFTLSSAELNDLVSFLLQSSHAASPKDTANHRKAGHEE